MHNRAIAVLLLVAITVLPMMARAQGGYSDYTGTNNEWMQYNQRSFQGGIRFMPPTYGGNTTILRGGASTGGVCGFDFRANLVAQMNELLQIGPDLIIGFIAGGAMEFLCQTFPDGCDLYKDGKQYAQFLLRFQRASCEAAMELGGTAVAAIANESIAECIDRVRVETGDIDRAVEECRQGTDRLVGPNGVEAPQVNVVRDMLETVGAPPVWAEYIAARVPNVTAETTGSVFTTTREAPINVAEESMRAKQDEVITQIEQAVADIEMGASAAPIDVPGQPIPEDALKSIAQIQDMDLRQWEIERLAGNAALGWELIDAYQAAHVIAASMAVSELTDSQRAEAERAYTYIIRSVEDLKRKKLAVEEALGPNIAALRQQRQEREQWTQQVVQRAPSSEPTPAFMPETGQTIWGYAQ